MTTDRTAPSGKEFDMRRFLMRSVALLSVIAVVGLPSPASAGVAPANDLIADATVIGALPFTDSVDTTTANGDGPRFCGNNGSVFYKFRPDTDMRLQVDTLGSDYDTVVTVMRGPRGNLRFIKCNDDTINLQSVVRFNAEADRNYFIEVSTCCGSGGDGGGQLNLTVQQLPLDSLTVDLVVTGGTVDTVSGDVTLEGTADCSHGAVVFAFGRLRQRRSDLYVARANVDVEIYCNGVTSWTSDPFEPRGFISFGAGDAKLRLFEVFAFDGRFHFIDDESVEVITLTE
jgi:hypothetical protein